MADTLHRGATGPIAPAVCREDDVLYYLPEQAGEKRIDILNFSLE